MDVCKDLSDLIEQAIVDDPPITIKEGGIIKQGYNEDVDEYKKATTDGKKWIIELEAKEREETGIKNLRIRTRGGSFFDDKAIRIRKDHRKHNLWYDTTTLRLFQ